MSQTKMDIALRKNIYALMIFLSLGMILGRIFAVDTVNKQDLQKYKLNQIPKQISEKEQRLLAQGAPTDLIPAELQKTEAKLRDEAQLCMPFFSANDRSRWCTIRALVEPDMRVEGAPFAIDKVRLLRGWDTIDMVKHDNHYYSSKPPLFPMMMASVYWVLYNWVGITFTSHLYLTCIIILACVNIPFMALFLWATTRLAELFGKTDRARLFMVATACFATFLSTFCVTLNNHLPATACATVALYFVMDMILTRHFSPVSMFLVGLLSMFMVINELPSLSLLATLFIALIIYLPWRTDFYHALQCVILWGLGILTVLTPILGTNYIAHDSFRPPYMHRSEGDNWYQYTYQTSNGREIKSYWQEPQGLDVGEPSRAKYAFHLLIGHHGVFSLTPIWILSMIGAFLMLRTKENGINRRPLQLFGLMVLGLTVLILAFYVMRPLGDRNYGGNTCGLRWTFWLIPLWLCTLLPALEKLENRPVLWRIALTLLLFSAISVAYPTWNPWTHPWLYNL